MKAIVMIAHGSKKELSNNEFRSLVKEVEILKENEYQKVIASFLEFEQPDIKTACLGLSKEGFNEIVLYPYFLNSGKHVVVDIPNIVKELKEEYPNIRFTLLPHFGLSKSISKIIATNL